MRRVLKTGSGQTWEKLKRGGYAGKSGCEVDDFSGIPAAVALAKTVEQVVLAVGTDTLMAAEGA